MSDTATYPEAFLSAVGSVLAAEGGLSLERSDPGNWTGGAVGAGELRGTRWGIAAASFPTLDIRNLSRDAAIAIYYALYWCKAACGVLPPGIGMLVLDAAVNNGVGRAVRWLQVAAGTKPDGLFGSQSLACLQTVLARSGGSDSLGAEIVAQRIVFMSALPQWSIYGLGWARRLAKLPFTAMRLAPA